MALTMLENARAGGASIETLKDLALTTRNWSSFMAEMETVSRFTNE
jgi:hypothetical protein